MSEAHVVISVWYDLPERQGQGEEKGSENEGTVSLLKWY